MKTNNSGKTAKKTTSAKKSTGVRKTAAKPAKKSTRPDDEAYDEDFAEFEIDEEFRSSDFKSMSGYDDEEDDF